MAFLEKVSRAQVPPNSTSLIEHMMNHLRAKAFVLRPILLQMERLRRIDKRGISFEYNEVTDLVLQFIHANFQLVKFAVNDEQVVHFPPAVTIRIRLLATSLAIVLSPFH